MKQLSILHSFFIALTVLFAPTLQSSPVGMATFNYSNFRAISPIALGALFFIAGIYHHWQVGCIRTKISNFKKNVAPLNSGTNKRLLRLWEAQMEDSVSLRNYAFLTGLGVTLIGLYANYVHKPAQHRG